MYDNPAGLIVGSVFMWLLTVLCVGLRFGNRIRERQRISTSDWLVLAGWIFGTGLTALEIYGIAIKSLGYRVGATLLDPTSVTGQLNKARHIQLGFLLIGVVALGLIKLSVCFLYWQLFAQVVLRRFLIIWMVIIVVWATAFVMSGLLECGNHFMAVFGTPTEYLEHCGSAVPSGYAMVGSDIATDFITLIIPIPVVLKLQMDNRRKLLTLMAFLVGALTVGASIAKGYIYIRSSLGLYSEDGLLILTGISIWNLAEVEIGIIAACGPLLRPVLIRAFTFTSQIATKWYSTSTIYNSKESHELPRFVKMPESEVQLAIDARSFSKGTSEHTRVDHYEEDTRSERLRTV
ncbi:hypothetical protein F4781DRAFT_414149 [Annulohypoxylon bovei var. microspora]|nr:hypothetical protein F4781DRAFT_414149 [Annulohypoxylon bovei var. microspora]